MTMSSSPASSTPLTQLSQHEQVVFCHDRGTGLRAIIAIHTTALGPALGGTRFYPYAESEEAALADVLRLSRAMSYKNAVAGLDHGGGKAVIIGDPATDKTPELLRAYGRFVESLGGRYVTACDVGTYVADMDVVAETTPVRHRPLPSKGGAGDSSVLTAYGVFQGDARRAPSTCGERRPWPGAAVGIAGVGKVGRHPGRAPARGRRRASSSPTSTRGAVDGAHRPPPRRSRSSRDVDRARPRATSTSTPPARSVARWTTTPSTALRARIVCGGANNQLVTEGPGGTADRLRERGITYCPGLPGQRRRGHPGQRRAARVRLRRAPRRARPRSSTTPSRCSRPPTTAGSPPRPPRTASPRSGWRPAGAHLAARPLHDRSASRAAGVAQMWRKTPAVRRQGHHRTCIAHVALTHDIYTIPGTAAWSRGDRPAPSTQAMPSRQTHEGVTPWGAAEPKPSRPRLHGS